MLTKKSKSSRHMGGLKAIYVIRKEGWQTSSISTRSLWTKRGVDAQDSLLFKGPDSQNLHHGDE